MYPRFSTCAVHTLAPSTYARSYRTALAWMSACILTCAHSFSVFGRQTCSDDPNFDDKAMMGTINLVALPGSTQACAYDATNSLHVTAKVSFNVADYDGDCDATPTPMSATPIEGDFVLCGETETDPLEECATTTTLTWICTDPTLLHSTQCEFTAVGDVYLTATLNSTTGEVTWSLDYHVCNWTVVAPDCSQFEDLPSTTTCVPERCEGTSHNCTTTPPEGWNLMTCVWGTDWGTTCHCVGSIECTLSIEINGEVKEDELACDVNGDDTVNEGDLHAFIASRAPSNLNELRDAVCCYNTFCTVLDLAQVYEVYYDEALARFGRSIDAENEALTDSCLSNYAAQADDLMGKEPNSGLGDGFGAGSDGNSGCGGGSGGGADPSSGDPVDTTRGYKREYATDLMVSAGGRGFTVSRSYTGQVDFDGPALSGGFWGNSSLPLLLVDPESTHDTTQTEVVYFPDTTRPGVVFVPVSGEWEPLGHGSMHVRSLVGTPYLELSDPGRWTKRFYDDDNDGLSGLIESETDQYGNKTQYEYALFGSVPQTSYRLDRVVLTDVNEEVDAEIRYHWHSYPADEGIHGRLAFISVMRTQIVGSNEITVETQRIIYTYKSENTGLTAVSDQTGSAGDLIQVEVRDLVNIKEVTEGYEPTYRRTFTQYRYYGGEAPTSSDERLTGSGAAHQLKMIINPQQIEYVGLRLDSASIEEAAASILALDDTTVLNSTIMPGIMVADLAGKIIQYETSGAPSGRVSREYLQSSCGCSGNAQGVRNDYSYWHTTSGGTAWDTMAIVQRTAATANYGTIHRYEFFDSQRLGAASTPYLMQHAIAEPGSSMWTYGRKWVWASRYDSTTRNKVFDIMPSAISSYTPATSTTVPSISISTSSGLVRTSVYNSDDRLTEERIGNGQVSTNPASTSYTLLSKTTYGSGSESHLVTKIERVRTASGSLPSSEDDIETTTYGYEFFSGDVIKKIVTTVEAELPTENGPPAATTPVLYTSYEMFDAEGRNFWSIAADGSAICRTYSDKTGRIKAVFRNADPAGESGLYDALSTSIYGTGFGGRHDDGGHLTTRYTYDLMGRVVAVEGPGGVTNYTVRVLEDEPPTGEGVLPQYAEIQLPFALDGTNTRFSGPAVKTWYDAGGNIVATSQYLIASGEDYDPLATEPIYTLGDEVARSANEFNLSGQMVSSSQWAMVSGGPVYETSYTYDLLGRSIITEDPVGNIQKNSSYDVLDRVLEVQAGTSTSSLVAVAQYFYDYAHGGTGGSPAQGTGDGLLTYSRQLTGESGGAAYRDTLQDYDYRHRLIRTINPAAPHLFQSYDNLDRVTDSILCTSVPALTGPTASTRGSYQKTFFSQRGMVYRSATALDPTATSLTYLETHSWFDPMGRTVIQWAPNSPIAKHRFDGLGREFAAYRVDSSPLQTSGPGEGEDSPIDELGNIDVSEDMVFEQVETHYSSDLTGGGSNRFPGRADFVTTRVRRHSVPSGDSLGELDNFTNGVATYVGFYFDEALRPIRTVVFGTNSSATTDIFQPASAPTWPPTSTPEYDDTAYTDMIVSATDYDARGRAYLMTDTRGTKTKSIFDDLGRRVGLIENDKDATVTYDSTDARWEASGVGDSTDVSFDRVTTFTYNGNGQTVVQGAFNVDSAGGTVTTQFTKYVFDATTSGGSLIDSKHLLSKVMYPDESTGEPGTTAAYQTVFTSNRLGEILTSTDQNGTVHTLTHDALGRVTADVATTLASGIDGNVRSIGTTFDSMGRVTDVVSYGTTSLGTPRNAVKLSYTALGQVENLDQDTNGVANYGTSGSDTRRVTYAFDNVALTVPSTPGNFARLTGLLYPDGKTQIQTKYGSGSGTPESRISRISSLVIDNDVTNSSNALCDLVTYQYVGLATPALVDYIVPDIQLDATVSHDGKRYDPNATTSPQASGVYPGWDRFGRTALHAWVDGAFAEGTSPDPNRPPLLELKYTNRRDGARLGREDERPAASWTNRDFHYDYDGLDRLTKAERGIWGGTSMSAGKGGQDWKLDHLGNWKEVRTDNNGNGVYSNSDEVDDRTNKHNRVNELSDRVFTTSTLSLTYDDAGNLKTQNLFLGSAASARYEYDAWGRLVRVKYGNTTTPTISEYEYDGLNHRIVKRLDTSATPNGLDQQRYLVYDASWRLLQEYIDDNYTSTVSIDRTSQQFWGIRYIDDAVARRTDYNDDGDYDDTDTAHTYPFWYEDFFYDLTDAQFSVLGLAKGSNAVVAERVTYSAYGEARHHWGADLNGDGAVSSADQTVLTDANGKSIGQTGYVAEADLNHDGSIGTADQTIYNYLSNGGSAIIALLPNRISGNGTTGLDNPIGYCGYVFNFENFCYTVRHRHYDPNLGRWMRRDPAGYVDGMNLYGYGGPLVSADPSGLVVVLIHGVNTTADWYSNADRGLQKYWKDNNQCPQFIVHFKWGNKETGEQGGSGLLATDSVSAMYSTEDRQYMVFAAARMRDVIQEINDLQKAHSSQEPITVIAHSQGTIITLAALGYHDLSITNFIMMGSPLNVYRSLGDLDNARGSISGQTYNYWSKDDQWAAVKDGIGSHGDVLAAAQGYSWITNREFGPGLFIGDWQLPAHDGYEQYKHSSYMSGAEFFYHVHGPDTARAFDNKVTQDNGGMSAIETKALDGW